MADLASSPECQPAFSRCCSMSFHMLSVFPYVLPCEMRYFWLFSTGWIFQSVQLNLQSMFINGSRLQGNFTEWLNSLIKLCILHSLRSMERSGPYTGKGIGNADKGKGDANKGMGKDNADKGMGKGKGNAGNEEQLDWVMVLIILDGKGWLDCDLCGDLHVDKVNRSWKAYFGQFRSWLNCLDWRKCATCLKIEGRDPGSISRLLFFAEYMDHTVHTWPLECKQRSLEFLFGKKPNPTYVGFCGGHSLHLMLESWWIAVWGNLTRKIIHELRQRSSFWISTEAWCCNHLCVLQEAVMLQELCFCPSLCLCAEQIEWEMKVGASCIDIYMANFFPMRMKGGAKVCSLIVPRNRTLSF